MNLLLYVLIGCSACHVSEIALNANCIPYKTTTAHAPNGLNIVPVLTGANVLLVGADQIISFANAHNQCRK